MAASFAYRLSGGASNSNPLTSLGGVMSSVAVAANAVFDTVTSAEAVSGDVEYRCIYVLNTGDEDLDSVKIWVSDQPAQGTYALAASGEGVNADAETVATEGTAPTGETFTSPTSASTGIELGPLLVGQRRAVWLRRTIPSGAPAVALGDNAAQFTVTAEYVPG